MPKTRTKKAALNIVTSTILEVLTMLSGLILPKYILQYFGSTYNGITSSATQFLSLISILTLGVTASTRVALYKTLAAKDIEATSSIIRATERYMRKVALILGVYILIIAIVYPLVVHTNFSYWDVALLILAVGLSSFAEYFFGITYYTFLLADQSVYISNLFSAVAVIINTILSVVLIVSGYSIQVVKLVSAVVFVLRPLLQNIYVTKKYRLMKDCKPDMSALVMRGDAMMHALANIVHDNTDIVVLTIFCDIKIVSVYTVYNLVMSALKKIQTIFTKGTEPIFGSMWAKGENDKIEKNLSVFEFLVNSYNATIFGTAMVMILPFISIYVPRNVTDINYLMPTYAFVISLASATQGMRVPYMALVQGIGHYKQTKKAAIIEATINMVLSLVLVNFIGIVGVAIGTLAANLYRSFQYAFYINQNVVYRGKRVCLIKFATTMLCMALIVIPSNLIVKNMVINSWLVWIMVSGCVMLYALLVVLLVSFIFYKDDLKYAIRIVGAMISRKTRKA